MMLHSFTKLSCILLALLQICGCIVSAGPIKRAEPAFAPKSPAAGSPQPARGPSLAARSGGKTSVQKPKAPVLGKPLKKNGHMDVNPPSSSSSATSESGMRVAEETRGGSGLVILLVLGLSIMSLRSPSSTPSTQRLSSPALSRATGTASLLSPTTPTLN
ncbi:hypothetical protein CC2G_003107 [Coprinopsis cinerea AmutBmut pab1-1]|nr:hypothetical protein CC2G_003107 [Coprinopsis cinerea AmutBmut pab1-1]